MRNLNESVLAHISPLAIQPKGVPFERLPARRLRRAVPNRHRLFEPGIAYSRGELQSYVQRKQSFCIIAEPEAGAAARTAVDAGQMKQRAAKSASVAAEAAASKRKERIAGFVVVELHRQGIWTRHYPRCPSRLSPPPARYVADAGCRRESPQTRRLHDGAGDGGQQCRGTCIL